MRTEGNFFLSVVFISRLWWKMKFIIAVAMLFILCEQFLSTTSQCDIKEISKMSFEIVEDFINKAKSILPDYVATLANKSESCSNTKSTVYLRMAQKLISEASEMRLKCTGGEKKNTNGIESEDKKTTTSTSPLSTIPALPQDCTDVMQTGHNKSGVYTIWPNSKQFQKKTLDVFCDMETDGGGWTVIQRRGNFTPQENFLRGWSDYKNGFGNITRDFWLGNDNLFAITHQYNYSVRFDLEYMDGKRFNGGISNGTKDYALYSTFRVDDETSKYRLHISGYSGNAGDAVSRDNNAFFSTRDNINEGNERHCSELTGYGSWWYGHPCGGQNLNGYYRPGVESSTANMWNDETDIGLGLLTTEIKIKRNQD